MEKGTIQVAELDRAEARLPRWMLALASVGSTGAILAGRTGLSAGFALGASVAILNYLWLHQIVRVLLATGQPRLSKKTIIKFLVRYPLVMGGAYALYRTRWIPLAPFLAGLFVPLAGAVVESVFQIRACLRAG